MAIAEKGVEESYMDDGSRLPWIISIILLVGAMFCALTETAFAAASRTKLRAMSESGNKKAEKVLNIYEHYDRAICTILIVTNIFHLSIASIVTFAVTKSMGVSAVAVSTIVTTLVVFFAGEMLPKSIAKRYPEAFAMFCAGLLQTAMVIFKPISYALAKLGEFASGLVKGEAELSVTEDEIYDIIEDMTEEGTLDEDQSELISSALEFGDLTVESIVTPRVDIVAINVDDSIDNILTTIKECNHSRIPVYEKTIDNIIGILHIRKFIKEYLKVGKDINIRSILEKAVFVHQSTNVDEVIPLMSNSKNSMVVVTDNYGGTLGIITVEDIIEELVGEIWDEDDIVSEPITNISENEINVIADVRVVDVFDSLDYDDPENDEELIDKVMSEWTYESLDSIPKKGDSFQYHELTITVTEMKKNRIMRLNVRCDR